MSRTLGAGCELQERMWKKPGSTLPEPNDVNDVDGVNINVMSVAFDTSGS